MPFVDSNIFVYHLANDPQFGKKASAILSSIEKGERSHTSTWAMNQVTSYLRWKKFLLAIPVFIDLLRSLPTLEKHETTFLDITTAYALQQEKNLPWTLWDDLVIVTQMMRLGIREIYSNDKDFDNFPSVKRIY